MKVERIINQSMLISGIGLFDDIAEDAVAADRALAIFHNTLNDINSDPKITLWQETWDYQRDTDGEAKAKPPKPKNSGFINLPQLGDEETPQSPKKDDNLKFPNHDTPFAISRQYPLPADCRRVAKAFSGSSELRKTDFSEIVRHRAIPSMTNMFAVNNKSIELVSNGRLSIVYAKQFKDFAPGDECDLPPESISYVINLLAFNLALAYQRDSADRCRMLAEKSYNALISTLNVNMGNMYQNIYTALNRFD
ncbi:MAG: hypothetical protein LBC64_08060 [Fibromonadaceae bacterium]|jgi:hypothetical protein|nr:hypothetical protein [Fibromonadaceae bacterium]